MRESWKHDRLLIAEQSRTWQSITSATLMSSLWGWLPSCLSRSLVVQRRKAALQQKFRCVSVQQSCLDLKLRGNGAVGGEASSNDWKTLARIGGSSCETESQQTWNAYEVSMLKRSVHLNQIEHCSERIGQVQSGLDKSLASLNE